MEDLIINFISTVSVLRVTGFLCIEPQQEGLIIQSFVPALDPHDRDYTTIGDYSREPENPYPKI